MTKKQALAKQAASDTALSELVDSIGIDPNPEPEPEPIEL